MGGFAARLIPDALQTSLKPPPRIARELEKAHTGNIPMDPSMTEF